MENNTFLKYVPFNSSFDGGFWSKLSTHKLEIQMLKDDSIDANGYYTNC